MKITKFLAGFVLLLIVLGFTLKMKLFFGWTPDLVIALLVAFGMTFGIYEVLIFTGLTVWILNWQPWPAPELVWLVLLALLSFTGRFFMPWQRWVSVIVLTAGGIAVFYALALPAALPGAWRFFLGDVLISVLFSFAVVRIFRFFYGKS